MNELWKMFNDIKDIIESDIASRFKYINDFLNKDNYKEFLDIFLRYFRLTLLAKISEVEIGDKFKNNFSIKNIQEIIKLSERINYLLIKTNVSKKLALETFIIKLTKYINLTTNHMSNHKEIIQKVEPDFQKVITFFRGRDNENSNILTFSFFG